MCQGLFCVGLLRKSEAAVEKARLTHFLSSRDEPRGQDRNVLCPYCYGKLRVEVLT